MKRINISLVTLAFMVIGVTASSPALAGLKVFLDSTIELNEAEGTITLPLV